METLCSQYSGGQRAQGCLHDNTSECYRGSRLVSFTNLYKVVKFILYNCTRPSSASASSRSKTGSLEDLIQVGKKHKLVSDDGIPTCCRVGSPCALYPPEYWEPRVSVCLRGIILTGLLIQAIFFLIRFSFE